MADLVMPKLGLTMTEGLLAEWRVDPGAAYRSGDILFVVETEKIANEVEAESDGVIAEILVRAGETAPVGAPIARLKGDADSLDASHLPAISDASLNISDATSPPPARQLQTDKQRVKATPLARRIARSEGVDLSSIEGTGPRGRIKAADVRRQAKRGDIIPQLSGDIKKVAPSAARAATARRVSAAKRDIPHFYLTRHVEISALLKMREDLNSANEGQRISITHMLIKGAALALAETPQANRIWSDQHMLAFDSADIGVVSETEKGLRIPVVRQAEAKSLDEIAATARDLAQRAQRDALLPQDIGGGALSISNVGMFGADSLTPIINPPQSMILGVGAEQQIFRPDERGAPALRRELILTLACDHRAIDGADAARFLLRVAETLEKPARLMRAAKASASTNGDC
ncbi:MAG: dihydrolipoamide acetyltransferase family protein [Pseudomonadota bacterium]|nr:dihydrolipoamide acetyltransferase family protein [Pseudomonadota bacterium]